MTDVSEIVSFTDRILKPETFSDLGPNGLQIPGRKEIKHVVTGVSANLELIERALEDNADLLLVHHGLLWDFQETRIGRIQAERLRKVLQNDLNLAMYHLPLDAHPEIGNNALIAAGIGLTDQRAFGEFNGSAIGIMGTFPTGGIAPSDLFRRVTELTQREPLTLEFGSERVERVGIISGAAASEIETAIELGLDAFITGEPKEHVFGLAKEAGIHFIAAGHHATETFGIKRLGELIAEEFNVSHTFIDVPNPI